MLVLGVAALLDVPVLDRPNDVPLVRRSQLEFHLIARPGVRVAEQQVEPACAGLAPLDFLDHDFP